MNIDLFTSRIQEKIKPLHGGTLGPKEGNQLRLNASELFRELGVPYTRLHDVVYPYGANQYIDIHCIFPDFDANVDDEKSYYFQESDKYIQAILDVDCKVFFRLGESIDHYNRKLYVHPPKDYLKWAKICEHIILHYNKGWANGFHHNIEYWEIWNEPEGHCMWTGTFEDYYRLYDVAATYLKSKFPDLKIGGYAASGFYALNRADASAWFKTLIPFINGFFEYVTTRNHYVPIDFFSWHCYTEGPEEIVFHSNWVREYLDKNGYKKTESILNEFNTRESLGAIPAWTLPHYASEIASCLIAAQSAPVDKIMYYRMGYCFTNCLFALSADQTKYIKYQGFYALKYFGNLYKLSNRCECSQDVNDGTVYSLSATDNRKTGLFIAVNDFNGDISVNVHGDCKEYKLYSVSFSQDEKTSEGTITNSSVKLCVAKNTLYYLELI